MQDQDFMDGQKDNVEVDDWDMELRPTGGRQRSVTSVAPEVAASAGGLAHHPQSRVVRPRSRSSTSTTFPDNAGHLSSLGESIDLSALSVEVAVAEARESQYSPARAARKQGRRAAASRSRSKSVYIPKRQPGTPSRRSSTSHLMPQERGTRSVSKVSADAGNVVDEDEGKIDEGSQAVIRRHQPQPSRPSVIDVFNLPQPNMASYSRPPRSRSPSISLSSEDPAASRYPGEPQHFSSVSPRCPTPSDLGGSETKVDPAKSSASRVDRSNRSPSGNKSTEDRTEVTSQLGTAVIPPCASPALSSITWLYDEPDDLQDSSYVPKEEEHGAGSATVVMIADGPVDDRNVETETGGPLEGGVVQVHHYVNGERRPASSTQRDQQRSFSREQNGSPREKGVAFDDGLRERETVPAAPDSPLNESARSTPGSHPLQSEEDRRMSPASVKLRNALSSVTDDGNRMEHALGVGFLGTDGHRAVEGEEDLDGLEKGEQYRASLPRSETAKTMSQTETPISKSGTPRSRGAASAHSRAKSMSSSYHDSLDMVQRGELVRRPSAHMQNKAKHMADQKRGVTTSYKSEELYTQFRKIALFLVVLGVFSGLGSHGIDKGIEQISILGDTILDRGSATLGGSNGAKFFFYWLYDVTLTGVAAFLTAYFAPAAGGSGIPAMKYMMDTDDLANKLKSFSLIAVAVKATGLMLASGGGLNIGREGPYTHFAGMVSYQIIANIPYFRDILAKETVLRQVLAASVAVGVSSTFAATIGGVLFSIEITTLYYDVNNYFKAFLAAISGTVGVSLVRTLGEGSSEYITRDFSESEFEVWQYPVYAAMGVVCGFLGPLYINFRLHMLKLARKWGKHALRNDPKRKREYVSAAMAVACLVATITAALSFFPGEYTRLAPLATFKELLSEGSLPDYWSSGYVNGIFFALPVSIVVWFITAALGTSVTVPAGDFIQTVVIGATVGRLIGEALDAHGSPGVTPSTFALVGAAAMSCGATQTISAAVVIMELTGSFDLDKPILLGAVVAFAFSRKFGLNIYDSVMALNGLESLYGLDMRRSEEMTAKDIMETDLLVVPCQTTIGELVDILRGGERFSRMFESYPVVTSFETMAFVGTISRKDLIHIVLTGGSRPCYDPAYFDYLLQHLQKKDLPDAWDKMGEILNPSDKRRVFERLPANVKHNLGASLPSAGNTVRALKMLAHLAPDLSFLKNSTSKTFSKRFGTEPRDPRDRNQPDDRQTLNSLFMANWETGAIENPYEQRPVNITMIAQQASGAVQIDRSVWKAHENMPLKNVYLLFTNLRCIRLFIISGDQLTGIISRSILYNALSNKDQGSLGESGRAYLDCSRSTRRLSSGYPKKRFGLDLILGRGPRNGL